MQPSFRVIFCSVLKFMLLAAAYFPRADAGAQVGDTLRRIDDIFSAFTDSVPGAVIRISRHDRLLFEKAYGMADLEMGIANRPDFLFEAGSVSKQFTAAAALLLHLEGKFAWMMTSVSTCPSCPIMAPR